MGRQLLPWEGEAECIEYTSMINIRPSQKNTTMAVQDPKIREDSMRAIVFDLVGRGEALP